MVRIFDSRLAYLLFGLLHHSPLINQWGKKSQSAPIMDLLEQVTTGLRRNKAGIRMALFLIRPGNNFVFFG
jgi:hypothetical protein